MNWPAESLYFRPAWIWFWSWCGVCWGDESGGEYDSDSSEYSPDTLQLHWLPHPAPILPGNTTKYKNINPSSSENATWQKDVQYIWIKSLDGLVLCHLVNYPLPPAKISIYIKPCIHSFDRPCVTIMCQILLKQTIFYKCRNFFWSKYYTLEWGRNKVLLKF